MQRLRQRHQLKVAHFCRLILATLTILIGVSLAPATVLATDQVVNEETTQPIPSGGSVYNDHPDVQNILGVASQFHIFARHAKLTTHTAGNLAVETLDGHVDFGTTNKLELLDRDITYLKNIIHIANSSFVSAGATRCNKVIFGEQLTVDVSNPQEILVNNFKMDHLTADEVYQDQPGEATYLDFDQEFGQLINTNLVLSNATSQAEFTNADFSDHNSREIDISELDVIDGKVIINLSTEVLSIVQPLTVKGLSTTDDGPTVIFNVDTGGNDYQVNSPIKIIYDDGTIRNNKDADDYGDNHLLWNFHNHHQTVMGTVTFNATSQGSVLIPNGHLVANQNMDGNLIAKDILIAAESHRWDLQDTNHVTDIKDPDDEDDITKPDPDEEDDVTKPDPDEEDDVTKPDPDEEDDVTKPDPDEEDDVTKPDPDEEDDVTKPDPDEEDDVTNPDPDEEDDVTKPDPDEEDDVTKPDPDEEDDVTKPDPDEEDDTTNPDPNEEDDVTKPNPNKESETTQPDTEDQANVSEPNNQDATAESRPATDVQSTDNDSTLAKTKAAAYQALTPTTDSVATEPTIEDLATELDQALAQPSQRRRAVNQALTNLDYQLQKAQVANDPIRAASLTGLRSRGITASNLSQLPQTDEKRPFILTTVGILLAGLLLGLFWVTRKRRQ